MFLMCNTVEIYKYAYRKNKLPVRTPESAPLIFAFQGSHFLEVVEGRDVLRHGEKSD